MRIGIVGMGVGAAEILPAMAASDKVELVAVADANPRVLDQARASYQAEQARLAELQAQEELDAIRPDLDGNEIMTLLGIPPGPLVGRAYKYLLGLRMERGPLGHDAAVAELHRWYAQETGADGRA